MCEVVVIIKRFRELSLACRCTAVLWRAQPAWRDRLRENLGWALKKYVPGWKWDRGRPRWNVLRKPSRPGEWARSLGVRRGYAGESRRNGTPPNLVEVRRGVTVVGDLVWAGNWTNSHRR